MNLSSPVTTLPYISTKYGELLTNLGITTIKDLITYFPRTYKDAAVMHKIEQALLNPQQESVWQFQAHIKSFKNITLRSRKTLQSVVISDETGQMQISFFNQPFLKNVLSEGTEVVISVKPSYKGSKVTFYGSDYEVLKNEDQQTVHTGRIVPEYSLTEGVTKKWFRNRIHDLVEKIQKTEFSIPNELDYIIPNEKLQSAITAIHFPEDKEDFIKAEKLLSLYELTNLQLKLQKKRKEMLYKTVNFKLNNKTDYITDFVKTLPFKLTKDQEKVLQRLVEKFHTGEYINDLVQGDVGSGKTVIAQFIGYLCATHSFQTVLLAPTTVLAEQHYKSFSALFKNSSVQIELVTGSTKTNKIGADILIGTTAVLKRKHDVLHNVGVVIVDEQQRFGVNQREELLEVINKKQRPHFIQLTATPIPRTIAETFFGDVEVHTIHTKPTGRIPIQTRVVPDTKRENMIHWIKDQISKAGEQAFWICPLIEGDEKKSVMSVYKEVKKIFEPLKIGTLHGKLKAEEKQKVMTDFLENKYNILISTTVIEVGVDVANATIMVIDNAESFGLAQLHQIRGRVGRNAVQSWCFVLHDNEVNQEVEDRLQFFATHSDGLEIAEYDLQRRGPGEVYGTKQSGIPNLKIAKLNDIALIQQSKKIAESLFNNNVKSITLFTN